MSYDELHYKHYEPKLIKDNSIISQNVQLALKETAFTSIGFKPFSNLF